MLVFVHEKLRDGEDGDSIDLTEYQADQLVAELEELAEMRIKQVMRQSQSQAQSGGAKQEQKQQQKNADAPSVRPTVVGLKHKS